MACHCGVKGHFNCDDLLEKIESMRIALEYMLPNACECIAVHKAVIDKCEACQLYDNAVKWSKKEG